MKDVKGKMIYWDNGPDLFKLVMVSALLIYGFLAKNPVIFVFLAPMIAYWVLFTPHFSSIRIYENGVLVAQSKWISIRRKFLRWSEVSAISISGAKSGDEIFADGFNFKLVRLGDLRGNEYRNLLSDVNKAKKILSRIIRENKLTNLSFAPPWAQ